MVDARKYLGIIFVKLEELDAGGRRRSEIDRTEEGKYGKLNLVFTDHTAVGLSATNLRGVVKEFGPDTEKWSGRVVELSAGELEFQDKMQPAILVTPVPLTPEERAAATANLSKPAASGDDMGDDSIPF